MARIEPNHLKVVAYFICFILSIFATTSLILSFAPLNSPLEAMSISGRVVGAYESVRDLIFSGLGLWPAPPGWMIDLGIAYVFVRLAFSRIYVAESKPFRIRTSQSQYVIWALWPLSFLYFVPWITNLFDRRYAMATGIDEAPVHNYGGEYRRNLFRKCLPHLVVVVGSSVILCGVVYLEYFFFG